MSETVQHAQTRLIQQLTQAGIDTAAQDAKQLLQHALNCDGAALVRETERVLSEEDLRRLESLLERRLRREPVAQITGKKAFWKDEFIVSSHVLSPRPDSETLIEAMCKYMPDRERPYDILDLGTGSGCLLLSLLREYPNARGTGIDLSQDAIDIARQNAMTLGMAKRASFVMSNWMQTLQTDYDMIITNPPYIKLSEIETLEPEVKAHEPELALSGGEDGLTAYRQILHQVSSHLKHDGVLVLELGAGQAPEVAQLAEETASLSVRDICLDLAGIERAMVIGKTTN